MIRARFGELVTGKRMERCTLECHLEFLLGGVVDVSVSV